MGTLHEKMKEEIERNKQGGDENIGRKVGSSTLLVKKIGQGAMGAVYLGYDERLDRKVAVKVLLREMFSDERQFEYLRGLLIQEGRNLAKVIHPGIITVHEVDADYPALIMEYISGMDFHTFLYDRREQWKKAAFKKWFISRMQEVAEALRYAHSHGLIHKDLKLSNVMISRNEDGKWNKITIIDFGLAQDNRKIKLTDGEVVLGTPSYMAPEQWEDTWELDRRTDVFAFGVMLYEVLMEVDFHVHDEIPQIKADLKTSGFLESRVGHLPIDQRTVFELLLATNKIKRAGGMLEVIGLLKSLQLSLTHREKEFPGTSFPKPSQNPVQEKKPNPRTELRVKRGKTVLGHPSADLEGVAKPTPASEGESVEISMIVDEIQVPELAATNKKVAWKPIAGVILLILVIAAAPYFYFNRDGEASTKTPVTKKVVKKVATPATPRKEPVIHKPPVKLPTSPAPPKLGELPSLKYITYLFRKEKEWCSTNDKNRDKFSHSPLWLTWCLRKRATKLYRKDKNNPELAIVLLDEIYARMCFYEMVYRRHKKYIIKDVALQKECKRIRNLMYKRFTYFISGKRLRKIDEYLQGRRAYRAKLREHYRKTHHR